MKTFITLVFVFSFVYSDAQVKRINRLESRFNQEETGDYQHARGLIKQTTDSLNSISDKNGLEYGLYLQILGNLYMAMGDRPLAYSNFIKCEAILYNTVGMYNDYYIKYLDDFAYYYFKGKAYDTAQNVAAEILPIWKRMKSHNQPVSLEVLACTGKTFGILKNYKIAQQFADEAYKQYFSNGLNPDGDDMTLGYLGLCEWELKGPDSLAAFFFKKAISAYCNRLSDKINPKDEGTFNVYKADCTTILNIMLSMLVDAPSDDLLLSAMNTQLFLKGLAIRSFTKNKEANEFDIHSYLMRIKG